jgi:hypothetical protein
MQFSINTPSLLFPAITLLMLAYTNRFLALATLIRNLKEKYKQVPEERNTVHEQIKNLKRRLVLIKQMQAAGIFSFFLCVLSMLFFYIRIRDFSILHFWPQSLFSTALTRAFIE